MNRATVFGKGINDADYNVVETEYIFVDGKRKQKQVWICPYYLKWKSMLKRCYSAAYLNKHPTYNHHFVCNEWLFFSNFRLWMDKQVEHLAESELRKLHLDKDLLVQGNKIYSPETCCLISQEVNKFMLERDNHRGPWPLGVIWNKKINKFVAQCSGGLHKKRIYIGVFDDPNEAHAAWLKTKRKLAIELASTISDISIANALVLRYENYKSSEELK